MTTPRAPTLVVLAAGLGSRYGGAKQIAGVGPGGEWLLEYALHDALAAGFARVLLVVRPELRDLLTTRLAPLVRDRATLQCVIQDSRTVPAGCPLPGNRQKPLGTGHALWCCTGQLDGPFAVINADDYYGPHAFELLARHFRASDAPAMVGYRLDATLSPHGGVNRGICTLDADDCLRDVREYTDIAERDGTLSGTAPDGTHAPLAVDAVVSLNCWGLTPALLPDLEDGLRHFLATAGPRDEYYLPHAIARHLALRGTRLAVLRTRDAWLGLTYPGDREHASRVLATLPAVRHGPRAAGQPA